MAYCTAANIISQIPLLPQTTTAAGYTATAAIIASHISRADALIDGKCAARYTVPFTTTPALVQSISEDITSYYTFRSLFSRDNQNINSWVDRYKEAIKMLDEIRDGNLDLVGAVELTPEKEIEERITSTTENYYPFFDVDSDLSWAFNADELDDVGDNR
jgi:phage gp36-like protein